MQKNSGIQIYTAKLPCLYGKCTMDNLTQKWIKGSDVTANDNKGNRNICLIHLVIKGKYWNITRNEDPNCPLIVKVTLPPLHTILLGPVNYKINTLVLYNSDVTKILMILILNVPVIMANNLRGWNVA